MTFDSRCVDAQCPLGQAVTLGHGERRLVGVKFELWIVRVEGECAICADKHNLQWPSCRVAGPTESACRDRRGHPAFQVEDHDSEVLDSGLIVLLEEEIACYCVNG